ncbi:hypothetical protein HNV12_23340 [Methanococcoides sp. SA1]|nr:hypothetical protein [Methanococcoides sp. SA1]
MEKKDTVYVIFLAVSLFSLSLMLFSQGITSLSISLRDGNNVAVEVPTLFPLTHVLAMFFMVMIATYCFTMLTQGIWTSRNYHTQYNDPITGSFPYTDDDPLEPDTFQDVAKNASQLPQIVHIPDSTAPSLPDSEQKKMIATKILEGDARELYKIIAEKGEILQSDLVLESGFSKVKVSRTLKKLQDKYLIERKPYGNTNMITLSK